MDSKKQYRADHKRLGLCANDSNPVVKGFTTCKKCRDYHLQFTQSNAEMYRKLAKEYYYNNKKICIEKSCNYQKVKYFELRMAVFDLLGAACFCCGESNREFLAIDHINGGGRIERRKLGQIGMLKKIINSDSWVKEYQLLCHNCNSAKAIYGECKHKWIGEVFTGIPW